MSSGIADHGLFVVLNVVLGSARTAVGAIPVVVQTAPCMADEADQSRYHSSRLG